MKPWLIYGAYGTTGRVIAEGALARGHRVLLAGRDPARLTALGQVLGTDWVVLDLADRAKLQQTLAGCALVLHTAGPYLRLGPPMLEACLAAGTPYIDIAGEVDFLLEARRHDEAARARGIPLVLGAGFAVTTGELLALRLAAALPDADRLRIGKRAYTAQRSPAVSATISDTLERDSAIIADGQVKRGRLADQVWRGQLPDGPVLFGSAPYGDLIAAHWATGIADIAVGQPVPRLAIPLLRNRRLSRLLLGRMRRPGALPAPADARSHVWAEASSGSGRSATALLSTGEGVAFTAEVALRVAEAVMASGGRGVLTPVAGYGESVVLSVPGVTLSEIATSRREAA